MQVEDDRTDEQRQTHRYLVGGTDRCLSGWGLAAGGVSFAFWACEGMEAARVVQRWVASRGDIKRVRMVYDGDGKARYRPQGRGHCHIYDVTTGHPALAELEQARAEAKP